MTDNQIQGSVPQVSVIAPAMDEEGNIDEFCRQFAEMRRNASFTCELVLIDDGSVDSTWERIQANQQKYDFIKAASHQRNRGLTEALQTGFEIASAEIYVFYPTDLQYKPEDIPALTQPVLDGYDICTGWKQGFYKKRLISSIYNWFSRKLFSLKVHDLNSVKAFRKEVVTRIFLRRDWHRYLVVLGASEGYKVTEVKVPVYSREWGQSKFSVWRIPVGLLDMLAVKFQITFLRKPLLFFGAIGLGLFALGILVGIYAVYQRYFLMHGDRTFLYLVLLLLGLGGGLFMLGFVAEGQTAIKEELGDLRQKTNALLEELIAERKRGRQPPDDPE